MKKIFIVTDGEYSDYRILAVYDDRTLAELFAARANAEVEEHDLNPIAEEVRSHKPLFHVKIIGDVFDIEQVDNSSFGYHFADTEIRKREFWNEGEGFDLYVYADDSIHARKIAADKKFAYNCDPTRGGAETA